MTAEAIPPTNDNEAQLGLPCDVNGSELILRNQSPVSHNSLRRKFTRVLAVAALTCAAVVSVEAMHPSVADASCCSANAQTAFDFFEGEGYSATQSAAWVGNLAQESSVVPTAVQPNGVGHGIAQWSEPGRWDNEVAYATAEGQSEWSLNLQLNFMEDELTGAYSSVATEVKATNNITTATEDICNDYEIAGTCGADNRVAYAEQALLDYGNSPATEQVLLDGGGNVWAETGTPQNAWTEETPGSGGNKAIASGDGVQMLLDAEGEVWAESGSGNSWTLESPTGITKIAVASNGMQMIMDGGGAVWAKTGIGYGGWTQETPDGESAISAGTDQMILDGGGNVWAESATPQNSWTQETTGGSNKAIAAGDGVQMLLDPEGEVWAEGTTPGNSWTLEAPSGETAISAGSVQMILDGGGNVWAESTSPHNGWTEETTGGGNKAISAGNGVQMLLDPEGEIWGESATPQNSWTLETSSGETAIAAGK